MESRLRIREIDGLRAIAVLGVLAYHAAMVTSRGQNRLWMLCGSHGVDLFFCISGFCLSYPVLLRRDGATSTLIDYRVYLSRRILRIAPPYLVALTLFAVLSLTGFGMPTAASHLKTSIAALLHSYLLDTLFLTGPIPAFNGSFWTMGVEMSWYLFFPVALLLFVKSKWGFALLTIACAALSLTTYCGGTAIGAFPAFAAGIFVAQLRVGGVKYGRYGLVAAVCFGVLALLQPENDPLRDRGNPLWELVAFSIVLASECDGIAHVLRWKPLRSIGIASFSIYLIHQPIESFVMEHGFSIWVGGLAGFIVGVVFYELVERPLTSLAFRNAAGRTAGTIARYVTCKTRRSPSTV